MTRTAKTALTATAAALLAAGVTLTTGASGWTPPAWLQNKAPSSAPLTGDATPSPAPTAAAAAAVVAPPPAA
ncbi:MAG: hypothetical protein ACT6S0_22605, partial [Roseateles sp.]